MRGVLVALMGLAVGSAAWGEGALTLPGGPGDARYPNHLIFSGEPAAAPVPDTAACKLTARYMDLVDSGRVGEVAGLFSENAFFYEPASQTVTRGRKEIDEFFNKTIGPMSSNVIPVAYIGSGDDCAVEIALETRWGGQTQFTIVSLDHFTLGADGKFSRMIAFVRPMPPGMRPAAIPAEMLPNLSGYTPGK